MRVKMCSEMTWIHSPTFCHLHSNASGLHIFQILKEQYSVLVNCVQEMRSEGPGDGSQLKDLLSSDIQLRQHFSLMNAIWRQQLHLIKKQIRCTV
jgi:hypothetical protein